MKKMTIISVIFTSVCIIGTVIAVLTTYEKKYKKKYITTDCE